MLVHLLCRTFDEPLPEKLDRLSISNDQESSVDATHSDSDKDTGMGSDDELEDTTETDEEQEENLEFDEEYELYDDDVSANSVRVAGGRCKVCFHFYFRRHRIRRMQDMLR